MTPQPRTLSIALAASVLTTAAAGQSTQRPASDDATGRERHEELWSSPRPLRAEAPGVIALGTSKTFLSTDADPDGDMPREVVMTADGTTALVVNRDTDNLAFFDLATRTVTDMIAVGDFPVDVALTPDGTLAVVTNVFSNDVSIVDVASRTKLADVAVTGLQPFAVEITPDSQQAVVAVINDGVASSFSLIDLGTQSEALSFPSGPQGGTGFFFTPEPGISGNLFTPFALSPDGTTIVLPDRGGDVVRIYERATGALRATLATATDPAGVDISADSTTAVVTHEGTAQTVSVIDLGTDTLTVAHNIGISLQNRLVRITPDGTHAICAIQNAVAFVNLASGLVTSQVGTGSPGDIEITFDGQYAFVSNFNSRLISIATQSLVATMSLAPTYEAALSPVALRGVALDNRFREDVHVYTLTGGTAFAEGRGLSGTVPEGDAARTLGISGDGLVAVVAHNTSRSAAVIDLVTSSVRAYLPTGDRSLGIAVSADGTTAVVANGDEDTVSILDLQTDTTVLQLPIVQRPTDVLISPDSSTAYVTTVAGTDRLHFIQLAGAGSSVLSSLPTGQLGSAQGYAYTATSGIGLTDDGSLLGVCVSFDDQLMLVDTSTRTEVARVAVGDFPYQVAFNPAATRAWVINSFGDSVSVVDINGGASTTVATVPGIDFPSTVHVDDAGAFVYVANSGSNSCVCVIDAVTHAAVANVGLSIRVRDAHLSSFDDILYLAGSDTSGNGFLVRVAAAGGASAVIDSTPLAASPCELVFSESLREAVTAQPIPDGVDLTRFTPVESYCVASPNSTGLGALMGSSGTTSFTLNDFVLETTQLPPGTIGIYFYGTTTQVTPFGNGFLCIAGSVSRLGSRVAFGGNASFAVDYGNLPVTDVFAPGDTRYFQFWYRNPAGGGAGFNVSDGLQATFTP